MKRHRWLRAEWPISMRDLANRLKEKTFTESKSEGFVLDRVRDGYIEGRFVERVEYDQTVIDPFGKELSFHRIDYRKCEFRASIHRPGLEFIDAPRTVQSTISRLAEATDFSLAITSLNIDVLAWLKSIRNRVDAECIVDSVQIGAIELSSGIIARVLVRGSGDILEESNRLVGEKKSVIERVRLKILCRRNIAVALDNNGTLRIYSEAPSDVVASIRAALQDLVSHN